LAVLLLVAGSGLYLGGARREFLGPAFVVSSFLWLALAWRAVEGWRSGRRVVDLLDLTVFLFLAYAAWSVVRGPAPYLGKIEWLCASLYGSVVLTARHQLPSRKGVPWVLGFFVVVALIGTAVGFLHFRQGIYEIGPVAWLGWEGVDRPDYQERMSGAFGCPNHFGNYAVQASLAALTVATWPVLAGPIRGLMVWASAALAVGVYFSISRGSWLAWGGSHALWFLRWLRRGPLNWLGRSIFLLLAAGVLGAGWLAVAGDAVVVKRWKAVLGEGEGWKRIFSGEGNFRIGLAQDGMEIWKTSPWWGTGPATFDLVHLRMPGWTHGSRTVFTHNDYVNTLSDYGLGGAVLVALFWVGVVSLLWRRGRTRGEGTEADTLAGLGWGVVAAMLIHAWVDFNFHIPATAISCFLLLGLATAVTWPERPNSLAKWSNGIFLVLALVMAGVTAIRGFPTWMAWRGLPSEGKTMATWPDEKIRDRLEKAWQWDPTCLPVAELGGDAYRLKVLELFVAPAEGGAAAKQQRQEEIRRLVGMAEAWYRKAELLNPLDDTLRVRRATVLDLVGRFEEAERLYQDGLKHRPHSRFFHLTYGNHLWRRGDLEEAKIHLEKAQRVPGMKPRPGEGEDPADEARSMLEQVKDQIAKGGGKRQAPTRPFNPYED
jgi:O-antigen ligase